MKQHRKADGSIESSQSISEGTTPAGSQPTDTVIPPGSSVPSSKIRRATGPRSAAGKKRTKLNAIKHGIFVKAVLLEGESQDELDALWNGLRQDHRPEGTSEETLVEKLASLNWRYRRLLVAEAAEIGKAMKFVESENDIRQLVEGNQILQNEDEAERKAGLVRFTTNPKILERVLALLTEVRDDIANRGFNSSWDLENLETLYGEGQHLGNMVREEYLVWNHIAKAVKKEPGRDRRVTPERCVAWFLEVLTAEIDRLSEYQRARAVIDAERIKLDRLCDSVPNSPALDRLLKYEASIERAFDRTLGQLERLQRIRRGQPVLPTIKVDVSKN